ncbi:MAG: hypothetical protein GQ557_00795, partial [Mycoplasmataceae bacterium]|nr:hypothetical protein [Mycoplasmataceae bacterium]
GIEVYTEKDILNLPNSNAQNKVETNDLIVTYEITPDYFEQQYLVQNDEIYNGDYNVVYEVVDSDGQVLFSDLSEFSLDSDNFANPTIDNNSSPMLYISLIAIGLFIVILIGAGSYFKFKKS